MPSYYDVLGVSRTALEKDVRQAYRKLAREHHPDVNRGDKASEEKFKQINEAYSVLSDPEKRQKYDKYGDRWTNWEQMEEAEARGRRSGGVHWSTLGTDESIFSVDHGQGSPFDRLFGNQGQDLRRPAPAEYSVTISLEEAFQGTTRVLELHGGRRLEVKIPPGVDTGSRVRVATGGGQRGTVYLVISVQAHAKFERKGADLYTEVEVSLEDAILGGETTVPTLRGQVTLTVPAETQNGQRFRLGGQGMPASTKSDKHGDLYATAKVKLPTGLTSEQRELFLQLRESRAGQGGE